MNSEAVEKVQELGLELLRIWPEGAPRVELFETSQVEGWPEVAVVVESVPVALGIHPGAERVAYPTPWAWRALKYIVGETSGRREDYRGPGGPSLPDQSPAQWLLEVCAQDVRDVITTLEWTAAERGQEIKDRTDQARDAHKALESRLHGIEGKISQLKTRPSSRQ